MYYPTRSEYENERYKGATSVISNENSQRGCLPQDNDSEPVKNSSANLNSQPVATVENSSKVVHSLTQINEIQQHQSLTRKRISLGPVLPGRDSCVSKKRGEKTADEEDVVVIKQNITKK